MASIKRFFRLFLCTTLLCMLTACGLIEDLAVFEPKPAHNTIAPKVLTKKEEEMIRLLSDSEQEIYLFSYNADKEYRQLDLWVEIYKGGVLIDPDAGRFGITFQETDRDLTGTLAVTITHTPDYRWRFSTKGASSSSGPNTNYLSEARGYQPITQSIEIKDNNDIILYTSVFSSGLMIAAYDTQTLSEHPEFLKQYPYAHIIKCKFSKSPEEP